MSTGIDLNQTILNKMRDLKIIGTGDTVNKDAAPMVRGFNNWFQDWVQQGNSQQRLNDGLQIFQSIFQVQQGNAATETNNTDSEAKAKPPTPLQTITAQVKDIFDAQEHKLTQFNNSSLTHMVQRKTTGDANFFVTELQHKLTEQQPAYKAEQTHTVGQQKETLLDIIKTIGDEVRSEVAKGNIPAEDAPTKAAFVTKLGQRLSSPEAKGFFDQDSIGQILSELQDDTPALKLRTSLIKKSAHALLNMSEIDLAENLHLVVELDDSEKLSEMAAAIETKDKKEINTLVDTFTSAEEAYQEAKQSQANEATINKLNAERESAYLKVIIHLNTGDKPTAKQAYFKQELNRAKSIHEEKSKIDFGKIFKSIADPANINEFIANGVIGAVLGGLGMGSPIFGVIAAGVIGMIAKAGSSSAQTTTNNSTQKPEPQEAELASATN